MEIVLNLPGVRRSDDKLKMLKYGLKHSIEPLPININDALTTFNFIHWSMSKDFKHETDAGEAKLKLKTMLMHINHRKILYVNIKY